MMDAAAIDVLEDDDIGYSSQAHIRIFYNHFPDWLKDTESMPAKPLHLLLKRQSFERTVVLQRLEDFRHILDFYDLPLTEF